MLTRRRKKLIKRACTLGSQPGLAVCCDDEAGPFQAIPQPGASWQPQGQPVQQPHEYGRGGATKILTLFHPATGQVRVQPAANGTNAVLHGWLKASLAGIVAALPNRSMPPRSERHGRFGRRAWRCASPCPPLRLLLVWDNLAGHKTPEMVLWLCQHGIMPLYTPLGGSWLNMAEAIQRILKRRTLDGQQPQTPEEIGTWFEQTAQHWNRQPTPFVWSGKRRQRRRRRSASARRRRCLYVPAAASDALNLARSEECQISCQVTY
jgi:DDE superfamily endonuclease